MVELRQAKFRTHRATARAHITVQEAANGKNVDWMEKVSDEQYRR
jgi:hypothetical protein